MLVNFGDLLRDCFWLQLVGGAAAPGSGTEQADHEPAPAPAAPAVLTKEERKLNKALRKAAKAGDVEAVRRCLRDGADPNAADRGGHTALYNAAYETQVGCLEALCEAGADLDKAARNGRTPLIVAAMYGSTATVGWLLARGADWRLTDNYGSTALDWAKEGGEAKAAAALEVWIADHGSAEQTAAAKMVRFDSYLGHFDSFGHNFPIC